jgi:hypothetical protein
MNETGEGPIIWWPHARFRVLFAHESWSLPLAIHWEDEGPLRRGPLVVHDRGIVIGIGPFSCYIDLGYSRVP